MNSNHDSSSASLPPRREGAFILVGTPLGNLSDLSERVIDTLNDADVIAAEDTRRLRVLLSHLGIRGKAIISVDSNREESMISKIIGMVTSGMRVAYTTDAGMPGISDPGSRLVRAVSNAGLPVDAIPGPSAPVLAASLSGLCENGFLFAGFLPVKQGPRRKALVSLGACGYASIVFESPRRIQSLLSDAKELFGPRHTAFVGRELTKVHQQLAYGPLEELCEFFESPQRGELVVVFGAKESNNSELDNRKMLQNLIDVLGDRGVGTKEMAEEISELTGIAKKDVYAMLVDARKR